MHIQYRKITYDNGEATYKYVIEHQESEWDDLHFPLYKVKVRKVAKIRNQYNQVPHVLDYIDS